MTTTCQPCTLREQGQAEHAHAIEEARTQRLVLAFLNQANGAQGLIAAEIGECHDCLARFAVSCLITTAQTLALMAGSVDKAKQDLELGIMTDLNDLPTDSLAQGRWVTP